MCKFTIRWHIISRCATHGLVCAILMAANPSGCSPIPVLARSIRSRARGKQVLRTRGMVLVEGHPLATAAFAEDGNLYPRDSRLRPAAVQRIIEEFGFPPPYVTGDPHRPDAVWLDENFQPVKFTLRYSACVLPKRRAGCGGKGHARCLSDYTGQQ